MRRLPVALAGASLLALGLTLPSAQGSTPTSSTLVVPTSPGQSAHVQYTGTIPTGTNATSDCSSDGGQLSDKHIVNITAPSGGYAAVKAVFTFSITWTSSGVPETDDEILTLEAPNGSVVGSADNGAIG